MIEEKGKKAKKRVTEKISKTALFLAAALIVSLIENALPPLIPVLPYAKLGLSNAVLLVCLLTVGAVESIIALIVKCLLMSVFSGNFTSLLWSFPAGLCAYAVMLLLLKLKIFSITGISSAGGIIHNAVQIIISVFLVGKSVLLYLPFMMLTGGIAGIVTGLICHYTVLYIKNDRKPKNREV
ncbi:MAG: Gx transporter family protein [Clostridiales bacterium]|nr:Gx transporter family protein [Clostridiales bacterium]